MNKTIIFKDDSIEILQDGYNIINKTIYGDNIPQMINEVLNFAIDNLDMDNMDAISELKEELNKWKISNLYTI